MAQSPGNSLHPAVKRALSTSSPSPIVIPRTKSIPRSIKHASDPSALNQPGQGDPIAIARSNVAAALKSLPSSTPTTATPTHSSSVTPLTKVTPCLLGQEKPHSYAARWRTLSSASTVSAVLSTLGHSNKENDASLPSLLSSSFSPPPPPTPPHPQQTSSTDTSSQVNPSEELGHDGGKAIG